MTFRSTTLSRARSCQPTLNNLTEGKINVRQL
jgi:hypothetical protein